MARKKIISEHFDYTTPDGELFSFTAGARAVISFSGLGLPPVDYITQGSPNQHGETPVDFRYRARIVQILLREDTGGREDYWEARGKIIDILRPNRQVLNSFDASVFRVHLPINKTYALKVLPIEGPSFSARDPERWDEWGFTEALRFIAHDPIFYDPVQKSFTMTVDSPPPTNLVFPFTFRGKTINATDTNLQFIHEGKYTFTSFYNLTYNGKFLTYPNIVISGPVQQPNVYNYLTEERIFVNTDIASGETVTITLEPGNKRINHSVKGDITHLLVPGSAMSTFHIEPRPGAPNGQQLIGFWGAGGEIGVTQAVFTYYDRFVGV